MAHEINDESYNSSATLPIRLPRVIEGTTYTQDDALLAEAHRRQIAREIFAGVIYSQQLHSPIGKCIDDLELIAETFEADDLKNGVEFIPFSEAASDRRAPTHPVLLAEI